MAFIFAYLLYKSYILCFHFNLHFASILLFIQHVVEKLLILNYWLTRLQALSNTFCQSACLSVRVSATLMLDISKTKRFSGSCPIVSVSL